MADNKVRGGLFYEPGNVGIREVFSKAVKRRHGVGDITDGTGFDNENIHGGDNKIL